LTCERYHMFYVLFEMRMLICMLCSISWVRRLGVGRLLGALTEENAYLIQLKLYS
jgi:hypothetical protein